MNSENNEENNESKNDTQDHSGKSPKLVKTQNNGCDDQIKLNNNFHESNVQCMQFPRTSTSLSNGSQANLSDCRDFLDHNISSSNTNSSIPSNTKILNASVGTQLNHQNLTINCNTNLSKTQIHLNLSPNQSHVHSSSLPLHVTSPSSSNPVTSSPLNLLLENSCTNPLSVSNIVRNEDNDIRNNVDYGSEVEKCASKVSCSPESSPEADWVNKSYATKSILNNIADSIGSTSQGTCFLRPNINGSRETPGPSGLQRNHHQYQMYRHDSSSGNEGDMSEGEDYCIYTYKGNNDILQVNENQALNENHVQEHEIQGQCHSRRSSPEMDFLEMDFDPGPSCEQDTGDSDLASINEDIQNITLDNIESDPVLNDLSSGKMICKQSSPSGSQNSMPSSQNVGHPYCEPSSRNNSPVEDRPKSIHPSLWAPSTSSGITKLKPTGLQRIVEGPLRESYGYHNTSGDLISPGENRDSDSELWVESSVTALPENSNLYSRKNNLSSTLYHRLMAKKLMQNKQTAFNQSADSNSESNLYNDLSDGLCPVEKVMIWDEQEAIEKQITQIATSACGTTSAINALLALEVPFPLEVLKRGVDTKLREPGTPLPRYLISRSMAGATHKDLARGISLATNGAVVTKFFAFYPERKISLSHWLHYWISRGAVPIATLNLQHCGEGCDIPDAWHHQMIFGVGPAGIYLTNPLQCLPEQFVWHQLVSPSILLIRKADILSHWNVNTDLRPLKKIGERWRKFNVLGQVVNMIREAMDERHSSNTTNNATHIRIPASYEAGITIVAHTGSIAAGELLHAKQLPLL